MRKKALVVGFCLAGLFLPGLRTEGDLQACQICKIFGWAGLAVCTPVSEGQTGSTICTPVIPLMGGAWCEEDGDFCSVITAGGGGGGTGGGGGGGGGECEREESGVCPAECFSCGGTGGGGIYN